MPELGAEFEQAVRDMFTERTGPAFDWLARVCERFVALLCRWDWRPLPLTKFGECFVVISLFSIRMSSLPYYVKANRITTLRAKLFLLSVNLVVLSFCPLVCWKK